MLLFVCTFISSKSIINQLPCQWSCVTCMIVYVAPKAVVKKIAKRLFTNKMAIFMTKREVKYMVQILYLVLFRPKSGASLQNIVQSYLQTVGWLRKLDLRVNNWTAW